MQGTTVQDTARTPTRSTMFSRLLVQVGPYIRAHSVFRVSCIRWEVAAGERRSSPPRDSWTPLRRVLLLWCLPASI